MKNISFLLLVICFFGFQYACCQNNSKNTKQPKVELQLFSVFPSDIDGCSCYFSKNEKDFKNTQYFFVNDFARLAYIKINKGLVKIELINSSKPGSPKSFYLYKSHDFKLRIDITKSIKSADEVSKIFGLATLIFANGETQVLEFLGECDC